MLPRSSIATRRFTRTFLAASARDPEERLTVTIAGIISGVMPTAIARENSKALDQRAGERHVHEEDEGGQHAATPNKKREKFRRPDLERGVGSLLAEPGCDLAEFRAADRSRRPHALPEPSWTIVPMNAHPGRSRPDLDSVGADLLRHWHRLTGEHCLVTLELVDLQQAEVGRHERRRPAATRRHRARGSMTSRRCSPAVTPDVRLPLDPGVQLSHRDFCPVLVDEPQPDAQRHDDGDDHGISRIAGQSGNRGRDEQQQQERVADLRRQDREGAHLVSAQGIRPELSKSLRCFGRGEACVGCPEARQHIAERHRRGEVQVEHRSG